jgi:hypothetical protein
VTENQQITDDLGFGDGVQRYVKSFLLNAWMLDVEKADKLISRPPLRAAAADCATMRSTHGRFEVAANLASNDWINSSPRMVAQRQQIKSLFGEAVQLPDTGLLEELESGRESLSAMSLDAVRAHYNSPQPAQLNAVASAQGKDIHLSPAREQHLPHEAWHVVQGRGKPTMQMRGGSFVNKEVSLEHEADMMGAKALTPTENSGGMQFPRRPIPVQGRSAGQMGDSRVVQRNVIAEVGKARAVAIVGENHAKYLEEEMGDMYRAAEEAACVAHQLDYQVEHAMIPVRLSTRLREAKDEAKDASADTHGSQWLGETVEPTMGFIRPDDTLLRLAYFAHPLAETISSSETERPERFEFNIKNFSTELHHFNEEVVDSLSQRSWITQIKQLEPKAHQACIDSKFSLATVKREYLPILAAVLEESEKSTPSEIKKGAADLAKANDVTDPADVANARRSLWMYRSIQHWAEKMEPTVYKVGASHVDDMKQTMTLHESLPSDNNKVRLITEDAARGQFEEACPRAFEKINKLLEEKKRPSAIKIKRNLGPPRKRPTSRREKEQQKEKEKGKEGEEGQGGDD